MFEAQHLRRLAEAHKTKSALAFELTKSRGLAARAMGGRRCCRRSNERSARELYDDLHHDIPPRDLVAFSDKALNDRPTDKSHCTR
jgi:hypothetical protein